MLDFSVILPVYNERENLAPLITELVGVLTPLGSFEIIAVDDRSTDGSLDALNNLAQVQKSLRVIAHRVNAGQSAALATGFSAARGRTVITLDADGQNDPTDIPLLVESLTDGVAAVCGIRQGRRDTRIRRLSSLVGNAVRNGLTGDSIQDTGCALRVLRKEALRELPVFNGLHRFLPTLLRYQGYRVVQVPVRHRAREWGQSKYGIRNRLWRGLVDCFAMRWWRARAVPAQREAPSISSARSAADNTD